MLTIEKMATVKLSNKAYEYSVWVIRFKEDSIAEVFHCI